MSSITHDSLPSWIREFTEQSHEGHAVCNLPDLSKESLAKALAEEDFSLAPTWDGAITDVVSGTDETDHGKNSKEFPFHTDGVYYEAPPHYVILYCASIGGTGGKTFFTRTSDVIASLRKEFDPNLLESMNVVYMERERHRYRHPLIEMVDGEEVLRWSSALYLEPDIQKISEPNRKRSALLLPALMTSINQTMREQVCYEHQWHRGDLLIFNNRKVVHGRTHVQDPERERHLYRVLFNSVDQVHGSMFAPQL